MKKSIKLLFSLLLIVSILGASPIVLKRYEVEQSNNTYQVVIEGSSIENIRTKEQKQKLYDTLKESDVSTITFKNMSIRELAKYRDIRYMTVSDYIEDKENFGYKVKDFIPQYASKDDLVIMISKEDFSENEIDIIKDFVGEFELYEDKDNVYMYINSPIEISYNNSKVDNYLTTSRFLIDEKSIDEAYQAGFEPMLSIYNSTDDKIQNIVYEQIMNICDKYKTNKIQILSSDVIGQPNNTSAYLEDFKKKGISIVTTEFVTKTGLNAYVTNGLQNLIRGHQIDVNSLGLSPNEFGARIARAVKERNMRVIVVSNFINYVNSKTISNSIADLGQGLKEAQSQLSRGYYNGEASNYQIIDRMPMAEIFTALASASLVGLTMISLFEKNKFGKAISIISSVAVLFGAIIINKLQIGIGIKAYALGMGVLGACAAIIIPYKSKFNYVILKFVIGSLISTMSGLLVASIMYGTDYILKLKIFSGVKLLYILPPVLIAIWVIIDSGILSKSNLRKNLKEKKDPKKVFIDTIKRIKWYHILFAILVVVLGGIYITRSGNSGKASEFELAFRSALEKILYVRPRTKEFMLGYPALLVGFYMCKNKIKYGQYVFIVAAIGTMSTVNTFTHLHTPLTYSTLRTVYSVILGLLIGFVYIGIYRQFTKRFVKEK